MNANEWPACPRCGLLAEVAEVARMDVHRIGRGVVSRPHPAGPTYRCRNGHTFRNGVLTTPDENIAIREGL